MYIQKSYVIHVLFPNVLPIFCLLENFCCCQQLHYNDLKGKSMAHLGRIFPIIQKSCHNHKIPFANDPIVNLILCLSMTITKLNSFYNLWHLVRSRFRYETFNNFLVKLRPTPCHIHL